MPRAKPSAAIREFQTLYNAGSFGSLTDGQLIERFADRNDSSAQAAFAVVMERHGPMVWGVCRCLLDDPHEAADAFQATFLILVRRATSVRVNNSLGPWLYGVSRKVALRARASSARRSAREIRGVETDLIPDDRSASYSDPTRIELLSALDEEIERLPEPYRAALVLCDLAGVSHEEAARQFGCAIGTVGSRLARGRERLRARLLRRGFAPAIGLSAASIGAEAVGAVVPPRLAESTVLAVLRTGIGTSKLAGAVSASVVLLAEGVLKSMVLTKLKWVAATMVTLGIVAGGVHVWGGAQRESEAPARSSSVGREAQTDKHLVGVPESQNLLAILQAQVDARKAELRREEALAKLAADAHVRNQRLKERDIISDEELKKAQADVHVARAQTDVVRAELREAELRLEQAKQIVAGGDLKELDNYLVRSSATASSATLERRIGAMEQKLDQILDAVKK